MVISLGPKEPEKLFVILLSRHGNKVKAEMPIYTCKRASNRLYDSIKNGQSQRVCVKSGGCLAYEKPASNESPISNFMVSRMKCEL